MSDDLTPKARALLATARRAHGPRETERQRVLNALHARLGMLPGYGDGGADGSAATSGPQPVQHPPVPHAAALPSAPAIAQPAAEALGWSKLLAWKAGKAYLATLVIGGGVLGVSMAPRRDSDAAQPAVAAPSSHAVEHVRGSAPSSSAPPPSASSPSALSPSASSATAPAQSAPAHEVAAAPRHEELVAPRPAPQPGEPATHEAKLRALTGHEPPPSSRVELRQRARRDRELLALHPAEAVKPVPAPPVDVASTLGIAGPPSPEVGLIRGALTSLRDQEPLQALRLLDEHAARYPKGAFSTERRALHAIALCAAGRLEEGSRERARFLNSSPDAPIAARVRSACPR